MSVDRARLLRRNQTPTEIMLWSRLKRLRAEGYHFRRQAPFRGYYLDFVDYGCRLVVEVDGSQHGEGLRAHLDQHRDGVLEREGFLVLRYPNGAVRGNLAGVVEDILRHASPRLPLDRKRQAETPPARREGQPSEARQGGGSVGG